MKSEKNSIEYTEKPASSVVPDQPSARVTYNELNKLIFQFFRESEFQVFEKFKEGYSKNISEDYHNVDLICNLNDLVYNYLSNNNMSQSDKQNLKNLCNGIQTLNKVLKQYDKNNTDKVFVGLLCGYILKLVKIHFHD